MRQFLSEPKGIEVSLSIQMKNTEGKSLFVKGLEMMKIKKAILLLVPPKSGKSRLAELFCKDKKCVRIHGRKIKLSNPFCFSECEKDTEVVLIDDVKYAEDYFSIITEGITVNKKMQAPFTIYPQIIITSEKDSVENLTGGSYTRRFDIFELKCCNQ